MASYDGKLILCDWLKQEGEEGIKRRIRKLMKADYEELTDDVITLACKELDEYFDGRRQTFTVPLQHIGSPFQRQVWRLLREIPYGRTWSYIREAERLERPRAVRAVANANGANPISIFVPCHRVIGADGTLTGYGGGLTVKQYLLDLEAGVGSLFSKEDFLTL